MDINNDTNTFCADKKRSCVIFIIFILFYIIFYYFIYFYKDILLSQYLLLNLTCRNHIRIDSAVYGYIVV